ncbi:MAG: helix-turn-helix domain-containing protein [Lachnospiraceae bacterium]|nr:helix-turn-helix domain-containing protein [Lachnospiraceae bacterium]
MKMNYQNRLEPFKSYHVINYTFAKHLHNQLEVIYVMSGECTVTIDEQDYPICKDNMVLIFPYQIHNLSMPVNCELIVQTFEPEYAKEYVPYLATCVPDNPVIHQLENDCIDAFMKADAYHRQRKSKSIVQAYVSLYMSFLYDFMKMKPTKTADNHSIIPSLLLYMDEHFTEKLSLDILAKELFVTKYYISRIFSKKLHTTFSDYVNKLRVQYAAQLLINTDLSVSIIALTSGFESERTFYRVFKNENRLTPLQYRKQRIIRQ